MKLRNTVRKYYSRALVGAASLATLPAFAAGEAYDTSASESWIAAGIVAGIVLVGLMLGLVTMIGAGKKVQRAGT